VRHETETTAGFYSGGKRFAAAAQEVAAQVEKEGVAVVIPGLGSEARAVMVERNLAWLKRQGIPFDCWIFVYRDSEDFPLTASRFEPCRVVRHPGFWMSHLLAMPLDMTNKPFVLHLMDGIEPQLDVNLTTMISTMVANGLGHASPTFDNRYKSEPYIEPHYQLMARQDNNNVGRFVDFVELHMDMFTREYFACLQDNIDNENLLGWGMDRLLPALCGGSVDKSEVDAGRLGLMDQMTMVKRLEGSYDRDAAFSGFVRYVSKHPSTPGPTFSTLGVLEAPPLKVSQPQNSTEIIVSAVKGNAAAKTANVTATQDHKLPEKVPLKDIQPDRSPAIKVNATALQDHNLMQFVKEKQRSKDVLPHSSREALPLKGSKQASSTQTASARTFQRQNWPVDFLSEAFQSQNWTEDFSSEAGQSQSLTQTSLLEAIQLHNLTKSAQLIPSLE